MTTTTSLRAVSLLLFACWTGCGSDDDATNPCNAFGGDGDEDGTCDAFDNCVHGTNPSSGQSCTPAVIPACTYFGGDSDTDGVCDAFDSCLGNDCGVSPCVRFGGDADRDGICDAFDRCVLSLDVDGGDVGCDVDAGEDQPCDGRGGDRDGDDFCSEVDNCPDTFNVDQGDSDRDGLGDACDMELCDNRDNDGDDVIDEGFPDDDGDGVNNCRDRCPIENDVDLDGDNVTDCVDLCLADPGNDPDNDRICASVDNCPMRYNSDQSDNDRNGVGDDCDVERCDGINNDSDTSIDEGMADSDGDRLCDEVDACVGPLNDDDDDDICGEDDNCPTTSNPSQTNVDGDLHGDACDLDFACESPAPLNPAGSVAIPATFVANDLIQGLNGLLYASMRATDVTYGNQLVAIDPSRSSIAWTTLLGSEPNRLELTDDDSRLYVTLDGEGDIRMVMPNARRACGQFALGYPEEQPTSINTGPLYPGDFEVVPGTVDVLVVAARPSGTSSSFRSRTFVYDGGRRRAASVAFFSSVHLLDEGGGYGVPGDFPSDPGLLRIEVVDEGLITVGTTRNVFAGGSSSSVPRTWLIGSYMLTSNGLLIDPVPRRVIGNFFASGSATADIALDEVYYAVSTTTVNVYRLSTQTLLRTIATGQPSNAGVVSRIVRWGARGLALLYPARIVVLNNVAGP